MKLMHNSLRYKIPSFLAASNLKLNLKKAEFLLNGFKQRLSYFPESLEVEVNKIPVKGISTTKYLGRYYDENLRWQFHIKEISRNISSYKIAIRCTRDFVPRDILLTFHESLVRLRFDNCSKVHVWGCGSKGLS